MKSRSIFKVDFRKRKQLHFSDENYLNFTKKDKILHVTIITVSLKQEETKTSSEPNTLSSRTRLLKCPCHEIYRIEVVGLSFSNDTLKMLFL